MTRRGGKNSATHGPRAQQPFPSAALVDAQEKDFLLRKHRMLRRATGYLLARKYRTPWLTGPMMDYGRDLMATRTVRSASVGGRSVSAVNPSNQLADELCYLGADAPPLPPMMAQPSTGCPSAAATRVYTRDELINFWRDLRPVAKRALLRIHRDVYLNALDQYLVRHNLCCECHDNVIAEWADHERRRSGSRALQDVFSVFPPFLDDEDDDDDDEDDEEDEEEEEDDVDDDSDEDALGTDDALIDDEEVVFQYELDREDFRRAKTAMLSDEYLAALEVGKRQEDELLRLIQKEERYIIIREDHHEFIMDLIRCGGQFSSVFPPRPAYDDSEGEDDDDAECPGANTSHLAQEYLLEVLAIKFREQLESAYQAALQHSLAIQAELLRDEIAELQRDQKAAPSSKSKKKKDKKKKKKKEPIKGNATNSSNSPAGNDNQSTNAEGHSRESSRSSQRSSSNNQSESDTAPEASPTKGGSSSRGRARSAPTVTKKQQANSSKRSNQLGADRDLPELDVDNNEADSDADREVEAFRLLLEKINTQSPPKSKPKLVLPPGAFSMM